MVKKERHPYVVVVCMIEDIKIPKERMSVVIGKSGETKYKIEKLTKTKLNLDEVVTINGEALNVLDATNIVRAIGRGFTPKESYELMDENNTLQIIPLEKKKNILIRVKSRLIGTYGKARKNIEVLTDTKICVYGKTVSIIGKYENVEMATKAILKLIGGTPHAHVYKFLEKIKSEEN